MMDKSIAALLIMMVFTETLRTGIKSEQVSLHIFDFSQPMNEWV